MPDDNITFNKRTVATVTPADNRVIELRLIDWKRIYRKVRSITPDLEERELWAGVCFGVMASGFLTLIPLYQEKTTVDAWVKPTFWIASIAAGIVAFVILKTGKQVAKNVSTCRNDIMADMKEVHSTYFPNKDLDTETK